MGGVAASVRKAAVKGRRGFVGRSHPIIPAGASPAETDRTAKERVGRQRYDRRNDQSSSGPAHGFPVSASRGPRVKRILASSPGSIKRLTSTKAKNGTRVTAMIIATRTPPRIPGQDVAAARRERMLKRARAMAHLANWQWTHPDDSQTTKGVCKP
jgi:hypothetical protein